MQAARHVNSRLRTLGVEGAINGGFPQTASRARPSAHVFCRWRSLAPISFRATTGTLFASPPCLILGRISFVAAGATRAHLRSLRIWVNLTPWDHLEILGGPPIGERRLVRRLSEPLRHLRNRLIQLHWCLLSSLVCLLAGSMASGCQAVAADSLAHVSTTVRSPPAAGQCADSTI